jgi:pimeloyl-ACP methyl ester carboxylesterase
MKAFLLNLVIALVVLIPTQASHAEETPSGCTDGVQASGALYRICMPTVTPWNGDLLLFAHGYIAFNQPLAIPGDTLDLPGGGTFSISQFLMQLGFAYATTSYSVNGLAFKQGVEDIRDLVAIFENAHGLPGRVFLGGGSEGGIVTALSLEKYPELYTAGIAACGPIGSFQEQLNYIGNFRIVFDFFFPGLIPGSAVSIPQDVIDNWDSVYAPAVTTAIHQNPLATALLLNVTKAPTGFNPANAEETVQSLLWYSVFGTNDAAAKLGGQPFDNATKVYKGAGAFLDALLNATAPRFSADPAALAEIAAHYSTTGILLDPMVTMHTTGDQIIPYWHEPLYRQKVLASGSASMHVNLPVLRYAHCNFNLAEVLTAFVVMLVKTGASPAMVEQLPVDNQTREQIRNLVPQRLP